MIDTIANSDRGEPYADHVRFDRSETEGSPPLITDNRELFRVSASRLVDIFPDELVIQEKTISVIHNELLTTYTQTIPLKDVGRIVYVDGPFFARIEVLGKNPAHDLYIRGLPKPQAIKADAILNGLLLENTGEESKPHEWLHQDTRRDMLSRSGSHIHDQMHKR